MAQVALQPLAPVHKARIREWANAPDIMRLMNRARPVSESEHDEWFASIPRRADCAFFAIETLADRRHVGNVWLWDVDQHHRRAEVRIAIGDPDARGRGLGREAIALAADYAFSVLLLHRVYAYVLAINPGARRAFEHAGFVVEGTLREDRWTGESFTDVFLLGKLNPRR